MPVCVYICLDIRYLWTVKKNPKNFPINLPLAESSFWAICTPPLKYIRKIQYQYKSTFSSYTNIKNTNTIETNSTSFLLAVQNQKKWNETIHIKLQWVLQCGESEMRSVWGEDGGACFELQIQRKLRAPKGLRRGDVGSDAWSFRAVYDWFCAWDWLNCYNLFRSSVEDISALIKHYQSLVWRLERLCET